MKKLIASISIIASLGASARTFYTSESFKMETTDQNVLSSQISVSLAQTPRYGSPVKINVDGQIITTKLTATNKEQTYKAEIGSLYNFDGGVCDESEEVTLVATVKDHYDERDPHSVDAFEVVGLKAVKKYSWDYCHDGPEIDVINYSTRKQ